MLVVVPHGWLVQQRSVAPDSWRWYGRGGAAPSWDELLSCVFREGESLSDSLSAAAR